MKGVDVEDTLTSYNSTLQAIMCKASVPWAWQVFCWACEANVEELSQSVAGSHESQLRMPTFATNRPTAHRNAYANEAMLKCSRRK
jgi:hypothetical protein